MVLRITESQSLFLIRWGLFLLCPFTFFFPRCAPIFLGIFALVGLFQKGLALLGGEKVCPFFLWVFAFVFWAGASVLWSLNPKESLILFSRLFLIATAGFCWHKFLKHTPQQHVDQFFKYLLMGAGGGIVLLVLNDFLGSPRTTLMGKSNAQAFVILGLTLTLFTWPVLGWLRTHVSRFMTVMAVMFSLFFVDCDTAPFALICGLCASGLFFLWPWAIKQMTYVLSTLAICLLPFLVETYVDQPFIETVNQKIKNHSYIHRLYVMKAISSRVSHNWFFGYGLDSSRHPLFGETQKWTIIGKDGPYVLESKEIPTHPHNAPLQWWLELGFVGALLACCVNFFILRGIPNARTSGSVCSVGLYVTAQVIALVNLGFWQNWWLAILFLAGSFSVCLIDFRKNS